MQEGNTATLPSNVVAGTQVSVSAQELMSSTAAGVRKQFAIPKLDEKQLEMKIQEPQGATSSFVVLEGGGGSAAKSTVPSTAMEGNSMPLNSSAPAFVIGAGNMYGAANVLPVDSPSAYMAALQCQMQQYAVSHASSPESDLYQTQALLRVCPREVLLCVLNSLVEESPVLVPFVQQRCEKAILLFQQQQQGAIGGRFVPHGGSLTAGGGQWTPHVAGSNYESPRASSFTNGASPHVGSSRKGRGSKAREEGVCSVHHSVRSMNHLQFNKQTGMYECVSGFHCLEDGGSAAVTPSDYKKSTTDSHHANPNPSVPPLHLFKMTPAQPRQAGKGKTTFGEHNGAPKTTNAVTNNGSSASSSSLLQSNNNNHNKNNGKEYADISSQIGGNDMMWREINEMYTKEDPMDGGSSMDTLQNILQSVRELAAKEGQ